MNAGPAEFDQSLGKCVPSQNSRSKNIFIVHPSPVLTDSRAHGDGLLAYRYIYELARRGNRISVACEDVELKNPAPDNIDIYPISLRISSLGIARRIEYGVKMRRLFDRLHKIERFDIAHQLNPVFAGLSLGLVGANVPLVIGPYVAHWPSSRSSLIKTLVLDRVSAVQQRFVDAILVSGDSARARIVDKQFKADRIYTIPYGIDLEMFPEAPWPDGEPVILYVAGLAERKGIFVLLSAFDLLAARHREVRLHLAGDGPDRKKVENLIMQSPYRDRIKLLGTVARSLIPQMFAQCTVFCLASFGEPYGMSLVEAMASGRPVVATNMGGPLDLVDQRGGALVPPGDPPALARALEDVLSNQEAARVKGRFNRQEMMQYSWPVVIDRLEAAYESVIAKKRAD